MENLRDWRGNTIEVGDVILYAVKHSTSVEVNEAVVMGFGEQSEYSYQEGPTILVEWIKSSDGERAAKWRKIKRVTITNTSSVTVMAKHAPV